MLEHQSRKGSSRAPQSPLEKPSLCKISPHQLSPHQLSPHQLGSLFSKNSDFVLVFCSYSAMQVRTAGTYPAFHCEEVEYLGERHSLVYIGEFANGV